MNKNIEDIIRESTENILKMIGFDVEVSIEEIKKEEDVSIICNVIAKQDSNFIIGQEGKNLRAIQHLVRLVVRKKTDERIKFIIDVNSYKKERNESVVDLAKNIAEQVATERRSIFLRPMSAYERRLVHMTLADNEKITTESVGERDDRKIVIKIKETI